MTVHVSGSNKVYCAVWSEVLTRWSGNNLTSAVVIKILDKIEIDQLHITS